MPALNSRNAPKYFGCSHVFDMQVKYIRNIATTQVVEEHVLIPCAIGARVMSERPFSFASNAGELNGIPIRPYEECARPWAQRCDPSTRLHLERRCGRGRRTP